MRFVRIPREVLDKRAVEQGDVRFFELAALAVDVQQHRAQGALLLLTDFVIPLDDVPADVQKAVSKLVAVDRLLGRGLGQQGRHLPQRVADLPDAEEPGPGAVHVHTSTRSPGEYTVVVKVIDILGNDTTKTITVTIPGRGT